jgi:hypothetical protein
MAKEEIMKNLTLIKKMLPCLALLCGDIATAWAEGAAREADNSDIFVWIFLAFCALIIVAQLVPAVMLFMGFAKGAGKRIPEAVPARTDQTTP